MSRFLGIPTTARDFEFIRQKVRNNGCEFNFMTSANEYVRRIQFFCIEKELIQAIGRARLLNHDCTVYLFSDYPVPHAEQHALSEIPTPIIQLQPNIKNKAA